MASDKNVESTATSSSFSLQECISELQARKVYRSSQSNQITDDDLINQNKTNKQSERIRKPCKDGFCYCFASDSDDFRIQNPDEKKKQRKSDTATQQISDMSTNYSRLRKRESFPLDSKKRNEVKNAPARKVTAISKLKDASRSSQAPLIHIIQEIRNNCVVSEVRVNKQKLSRHMSPRKEHLIAEQNVINAPADASVNSHCRDGTENISEIDSLVEDFHQSSLNTSSRSSDRNGGRLLQKRLSGTQVEFKPRNLSTPPRKPPRNVAVASSDRSSSSTRPSVREAEKILDDFLRKKGISVPRKTSGSRHNRKSYPQTKSPTPPAEKMTAFEKPMPSCPSLSEIERHERVKGSQSCGVIQGPEFSWQNPKIREMLNLDVKNKNFQSNNSTCGPQVGWTVPPKQDIDTVDGAYHNLVANIESKSTPVKSEMINNKTESQKFILAEQLKNFVSNSNWTSKKAKNNHNVKKSNSFLSVSKTKLLRFVTKKSPTNKSIGVQTSSQLEKRLEKQNSSNLQSPPGSYFSNTPAKTSKGSQTEFDFSRTVHSPKRDKASQRKLLFPTRNVVLDRTTNSNQNQTYRSYNSDLDKDLTLSKMSQVLSGIRCRLEASDDHAVGTFRDIQRREAAAAALSYDCVDGYDYQRVYQVSARADVHNEAEPSYSEIEEDSFFVTESPIADNTNGIEHFVVDNDPKAIYAKINKTPKKSSSNSSSFNNIMEQNSPPKLRNVSKTDLSVQSEMFLENLISENNVVPSRPMERVEKVQNADHEDRLCNEIINLDDSYVSVNSFRESDAVSYELPPDNSNPINAENVSGNQSTPKKTLHLSKLVGIEESDDGFEQTTSCPATPGWVLNRDRHFNPDDESMSLNNELTATGARSSNSSLWKYRTLKDKLRKSIRKSGSFLKNEGRRLTSSLASPRPLNSDRSSGRWDESELCIANLFSMDEGAPVKDQLTQAVGICRQIPELEVSPEMVEAERLLLFSTLKRGAKNPSVSATSINDDANGVITVKSLRFPIKPNNNQELFFNFYYIGVFSFGGQIRSTQSAVCTVGEAIFTNCNISFEKLLPESEIRCDIFMLRLRKVSTSAKSPQKAKKLSAASTSSEEILSRFRPHATFTLRPRDFAPFHLVNDCPNASADFFCLHSANSRKFSITPAVRSTNLLNEVHTFAEVEQLFRKTEKKGFLNVQDASKKHNWNLRWCELDSLRLKVWNSPNDVIINEPVDTVDLCKCITRAVECAPKEVCARPRSFFLEFEPSEIPTTYLFSAENQNDLNYWISALDEALEFIAVWMK